MGCDIHMMAQRQTEDGSYETIDFVPFDWRSYGMFAFLAGVRNYSGIVPIAEKRGLPEDLIRKKDPQDFYEWSSYHDDYEFGYDTHSHTWLSVKELAEYDYDQIIEDRRYSGIDKHGHHSGACTCEPGEGQKMTAREFLGEQFFEDLERLKYEDADRIVFWFDN